MKTIIVGCGRMGSGLARKLESQGVDVTIIDTNPDAFEALGSDFKGKRIVGIGFDQDILTEAKIKMVDSVVACTNNDETNALIARIAQNIYRVPKVVARLYDAHKAEIYHSLGVQTISTTSWGIARAFEILNYCELDTLLLIGDGQVEIVRLEASSLLHGRTVNDVSILGEVRIVAIKRGTETMIPSINTNLVTGDILYVSVLATSKNHLQSLFGLETK
jgi:trk system potassium uptake protein TrkA